MLRIRLQAESTVKQRYILAVVCRRSTYKLTWGKSSGYNDSPWWHVVSTGGAPTDTVLFIGQCTAERRRGSPGFGSSSPERLMYFGLHVEAGGQVALAEFAKHRQLVP